MEKRFREDVIVALGIEKLIEMNDKYAVKGQRAGFYLHANWPSDGSVNNYTSNVTDGTICFRYVPQFCDGILYTYSLKEFFALAHTILSYLTPANSKVSVSYDKAWGITIWIDFPENAGATDDGNSVKTALKNLPDQYRKAVAHITGPAKTKYEEKGMKVYF